MDPIERATHPGSAVVATAGLPAGAPDEPQPASAAMDAAPVAGGHVRALVIAELRQVRGNIALACLCMLGSTLAALVAPWPIKLAFDLVLLPATAGTGPAADPTWLDERVAAWLPPAALPAIGLLCAAMVLIALMSSSPPTVSLATTSTSFGRDCARAAGSGRRSGSSPPSPRRPPRR